MSTKENEKFGPFDPEKFRSLGHQLVDILSDYLTTSLSGGNIAVLPHNDPEELTKMFSLEPADKEPEPFDSFVKRVIDNSIHIHHPRYAGHQVTSPLPLTALAQFCTTLLNNGSAVYEMGPVNMAMERNVIRQFGMMIGYPEGFDGIFTHGGTAGNLTAMLAARQTKTGYNIWEDGIRNDNRPGFLISGQSHYSISRNVRIMGLGADSAISVPYDPDFRMRTDLLGDYMKKAEEKGIKTIAVVANACSTATGTYDNLEKTAEFCERHGLWLHVDGAHGMGVLYSDRYRERVKGIERADSVTIDFHKMFLVPALNTLVMFRNADNSYNTFSQKASYLFRENQEQIWYNSATRTIECTKSALGIIAYTAIKYYGKNYFTEYIEKVYDLAASFAAMISNDPCLELATEPMSNIVCFRYVDDKMDNHQLNRLNGNIRENIVKDGSFYIVQTDIGSKTWLRTTLINPFTSIETLEELIRKVKMTATCIS